MIILTFHSLFYLMSCGLSLFLINEHDDDDDDDDDQLRCDFLDS